ncbi:MAG: hypothetical protein HON32_07735 [Francisellaceae bacterium]|jgi:type IV pilus assembly protein PilN|nr:hypothetical protein [Francisellaceae bacterium]MBT6538447.1 hypothetical protein [Francisellaceae bacterium]
MIDKEVTRINLLPWREDFLLYENRKFGIVAAVVFMIGISMTYLISGGVNVYNGYVEGDVKYLKKEIAGLEAKISEIRGLKDQKDTLLNKMSVIHNLQSDRLNIVKLFNNLAASVPSNIYLKEVARNKDDIEIKGSSENNNAISMFMRDLEQHNILTNTDLNKIQLNAKGGFDFSLDTRWNEK